MNMRLTGALITALAALPLLAAPLLAAPALQQMAQPGPTEIVIYTEAESAVVRRQSTVRLAGGANAVGFEWTTDSLDATSIRLQGGPELTVGEVVRPPAATKLLRWNVEAPSAGDYALTTGFLLSGLTWSADYRMAWTPGSEVALVGGWLTLKNETGMDLEQLNATFVLGRPGARAGEQAAFEIPDLHELAAGNSVRACFLPPIEVPVRTIHRIDSEAAAEQVRRILEITPPDEGPMARTALPQGPMTIITPTDVPPASFMTATLGYEPSETFEVNLGYERDIVVERRLLDRRETAVEFDRLGQVSGSDTVEAYEVTVRSHLDEPIEVELVETVLDTWELKTDVLHVLEDGKAQMMLTVPADGEAAVEFTLVKHSGTRIP